LCAHGIAKFSCKQCATSGLCAHGNWRRRCVECRGISVCSHDRRKYECRLCGGRAFCSHGRHRKACCECNNFVCGLEACPRDGRKFSSMLALRNHMQSVHADNPKAVTRAKELDVHEALSKANFQFAYQKHLPFRNCGLVSESAYAFIDFVIPKPWGVILLECDEEQHSFYDASCDVRRDFDSCASIALGSQEKAVVLRYNPDPFQIGGKTRYTTKKDRLSKMMEVIAQWDVDPAPDIGFARFFLFYDAENENATLPLVAQHWSEDVQKLSRRLF